MKPTDPVKEELQRSLFQTNQFRPEMTKIRVCTFWMSGELTDSRRRPTQQASLVSFNAMTASQTRNDQKMQVLALSGGFYSSLFSRVSVAPFQGGHLLGSLKHLQMTSSVIAGWPYRNPYNNVKGNKRLFFLHFFMLFWPPGKPR